MINQPLISVSEALQRITRNVSVVAAEEVSLTAALGRVTASCIKSRRTQPPVDVSAMDGYAVRNEDVTEVPCTLIRVGSAPAGGQYTGTIKANEAVRIFTGGPVPHGADTIVIQEHVDARSEQDGTIITIKKSAPIGKYIRKAGLDFRNGDIGIADGKLLNARDIGLAASMNIPWITVRRKPRIAILATGDEIVRPGEEIGQDQIVSSNSYTLAAIVTACGGEPLILGIAPDKEDGISALVQQALAVDLLVTTGGASVGQHDLIREALDKKHLGPMGLDLNFWKIAMRPGKPLIFGNLKDMPLLGLPGNPVSTMICGLIFLKPAIETMLGLKPQQPPTRSARLTREIGKNDERQDYLRANYSVADDGELLVAPFERQDSSMMAILAKANSLIVRAPHDPPRSKGETVQIISLNDIF